MIWYLLYPFRGTTDAPVLGPTHPLRSAFTRYGRYVARHVVTTLLISIAVAVVLTYPFPYLYTTDFTNGASSLPHHVWTVAQPLERKSAVEPDVIMRSIWVHGSYMKALDRDILLGALELQDELLGTMEQFNPGQPKDKPLVDPGPSRDLTTAERDAFHVVNGLTEQSWFFHSPLQYWGSSAENIEHDSDIVATVNKRKTQPTSVNVTLRHSIVFSGKRFEDRRLLAADALVITLIHLRDSPVGRQWERKAQELAAKVADKWAVFPSDGRNMPSQLYEFQFRPISREDVITLALAYGLAFAYTMIRVSALRAVKSKVGLIVTVIAQIAVSILSSFTVCAIFKIDLSMIPHAAYPIVILSMSLENIFRLINSVILTPSEDVTSSRIGHAFGETAHTALASTVQNCLLLWLLSKVVAPAVAHFCIFAAIAIVFDYFYLSTFFLSVLSVDVRRTELSDALARASLRQHQRPGPDAQPVAAPRWVIAMWKGKSGMSTRIAGTVILLGFVLIAQWHFLGNESGWWAVIRLLLGWRDGQASRPDEPTRSLLEGVHQARSPTSWLRLQDHDTAREVIHVVKPDAHSYVSRVFEPLVFVRRGADRFPREAEGSLLPAVYDFLHHRLQHFVAIILIALAGVLLLTNYLLSDETADSQDRGDDSEGLLSVKTNDPGHTLDVLLMSASADGHIVSVGLDRDIRVWNVQRGTANHSILELDRPQEKHFVLAVAVDDASNWLALLCPNNVLTWNLPEHRWGPSMPLDSQGQKVEAFFFGYPRGEHMYPLVAVWRSGAMTQLWPETGESFNFVLCKSPLVSAHALIQKSRTNRSLARLSILTASKRSCVHHAILGEDGWTSDHLDLSASEDGDVHQVAPLPDLDAMLVARIRSVQLIDAHDHRVIHTFTTEAMRPRSLRCHYSSRRRLQCGSLGVGAIGLVYTEAAETGDCVIQTYRAHEEGDMICFQDASSASCRTCCSWARARELRTHVSDAGKWEALPNGCVVGVRKVNGWSDKISRSSASASGLRRRLYSSHPTDQPRSHQPDKWEVWLVCQLGRQSLHETRPLHDENDSVSHLMINDLGPVVKVGMTSIAVAFGNEIKLITVGHERFGDSFDTFGDTSMPATTRRQRRAPASRAPLPGKAL